MRHLLPLAACCVSLCSLLQIQALPLHVHNSRLDLLQKLSGHTDVEAATSDTQPPTRSPSDAATPSSALKPAPKWLLGFLRQMAASNVRAVLSTSASERPSEGPLIRRRALRARRQAQHRGGRGGHHHPHQAQLMRVGCVLGTCQVQNLSHRLYQLIGQSGREDSSPINPRSPHSYG